MKNLIALAALLISSTTFAVSESDSWSDIQAEVKASNKLSITGDYAFVGQIVSIFDVCTDGESFITTKKLPVYKRVRVTRSRDNDGDNDGYTNMIVGYEYKSYPLNATQSKRECNNHGKQCTWVEVDFNQSTEKMISVKKHVRTQRSNSTSNETKIYKTLFKKAFSVPTCN